MQETERKTEVLFLCKGNSCRSQIARKLRISEVTYCRWRPQYGGMKADEVKRLKELEQENRRLKRLIGEPELDKAILKEALEGKD